MMPSLSIRGVLVLLVLWLVVLLLLLVLAVAAVCRRRQIKVLVLGCVHFDLGIV